MQVVARTDRLLIHVMQDDASDAELLLAVLTDPGFIAGVADRGVRDHAGAAGYIRDKFLPHQREHGYSIYAVRTHAGDAVGLCGLVNRPELGVPDIGYAVLPPFRRQGIAIEACEAVLHHARADLGLSELIGICDPDNAASVGVLQTLGFREDGDCQLDGEDETLVRYRITLQAPGS